MGIFKKLFRNKSKASKAAKRYDQRTEQNRGKTLKKSSGVKNNADGIKTVGKTKTAPTVKNVKKTANHGGNGGKFNTAKGNVERVNTVQSNVKAVSENKQKSTYSGMVAKDYQQKNSVIQKSKNDFKTEIESKLKNDGLKKNDFYSEKAQTLQHLARFSDYSPQKRYVYKEMAVDAVHQESFDKIKASHPEMKDEDIERYLKNLDNYGKLFQRKSAKAEKEAVQKNLDKIYEDVLKLRQDIGSNNIDYSTAQGQAAAKVMAFKNLELGGTPFETVNSKLAYEKVARNSKNDVLTAEAKKRAKKADDVLLKSLWAGGGDLVENVIPALAPYRNYAEGQKAKGNDVPASNFDENGYYKAGGVAEKFYNLVHAGTEKAQAEFDDAMAAGNGNLAKEFGGTAIYGTFQMVFDMLGMAFGSTETKVVANAPKALKAVHTAATATKNVVKDSTTVKNVAGKVLDVFGVAKDGVADLLKNPANLSRINLYHEQQLSANLQSGMDYDTANTQAWLFAVPAALVETGGVQKNIVEKASDTVLGKNKISTMETIANVLKNNVLPEAGEEVVQEALSDIGMGAVGEKVEFEPKKYAMAAAVGGTLGGVMGGPIEVYNSAVNNNTYRHNEMLKQKIADGLGISTDAVQAAIDDGSLREKVDTANEQMNAVGEYIKACKTEDVSAKAISKVADSTAHQKVNAITESEFGGSFVISKNAIDSMVKNGANYEQITKLGIVNSRPDYVFTTPIVKSVKKSSKKSAVNKNEAVNETAPNKMMTFVKVFGDEVYFVNQEVQGENIVPVSLQAMSYEKAVEAVNKMDLPQAEKSTIIKKIGDSANITVGGIVNGIRLNNQQMKTYRVFSTFANAKGGSVEVRNDLAPGNPGQIIKNDDGTFKIVLSDASLRNYVTAGHEFTHAIEGSDEYFELLDFIKRYVSEKGIDYNALIAEIKEDYAKSGATLDDALAERELMSIFCAKHMFDDQKLINRLANEHPNIVQRMIEWLSDMISKLKNISDADAKFYIDARSMYVQAYRSITQEQRKADFGRLNVDGESVRQNMFVSADESISGKADEMEMKGASAEEIWRELGVVRTMDGKGWRSEIDDSTAKINPRGVLNSKAGMEIDEIYAKIFGGKVTQEEWNKYNDRLKALEKEFTPKKKGKLSDFLDHDALYEKYPFLKNYKIEFEKQGNQDYRGRINPTYKVLTIVENSKREYLGTLLHEVQHAIQLHEKWPGGANFDFWVKQISKEYANDPKNVSIKAERLFHNIMKNLPAVDKPKAKRYFDLAMQTERLINDGRFDEAEALETESDALYAEIYHKPWFDNLNTIFNVRENPQEFINDFCKYLYLNTAGEIEARDTAKRSKMTAEERKKNLPIHADEKTVYAEDGVDGFETNNKKSQKSLGTDIDEKLNRLSDGKWSEAVKSFDKAKDKINFDDDVEVLSNINASENAEENSESVSENAESVSENAESVSENAESVAENAESVAENAESKPKENRIFAKSKNSVIKNTSNAEKYKVSADEAKLYLSKHKKTVSAEEYKQYLADDRHITDGYEGIVFSKKLADGRYEMRQNIADIFQCRGEACINAAEVIDDFVLIQKTRIDQSQRDALFSIFESEIMENAEADTEILTKKRRTFDYYIDCLEAVVGAKGDVAKSAEKPKSELPKQNAAREYLAANGDSVEISVNRAFSISGIMFVDINTSESGKKTSVEVLKNRVFAELPENEKIDFIKLKKSADEPDYITVSRYNALSVEKFYNEKIWPLKRNLKELKLTKNENDFVISIIKNDSKMPSVPNTLSEVSLDKVNKAVNIKNELQKELSVIQNIIHRVPYDPLAMHYASQIDAGGKLASAVSNTKNIYDNFETALRNADQDCKDYFDNVIFEPLRNAKRDFVHGIEEKSAMLKKHVIDYGIYGGTKESAALQWYGEGKKMVKQGKNYVEVYYGLEDLKAEFGNAKKNGRYVWENIVDADNFIRKQYDDYADSINDVLRVIYPNPYDENGNIIPGKRLLKRYDYYHHFNDESMGFQSISDVLINTGTEIDPHLLGISEDTKPKTKWTGFLQHRSPDGKYKADAVGGFIRYMQMAEYKLAIEPLIPEYRRKLEAMKDGAAESRKTAQKADTAEQNKNNSRKKKKNAQKNNSVHEKDYEGNNEYGEENTADTKDGKTMKNGLLDAFDRFINELAGKSNGVDRAVYHFLGDAKGREALNFLTKFQGKAKAAAIAGNVATMIVQSANAKNFLPVVSKKSLAKGLFQIRSLQICGKLGNHNQNTIDVMKESVFLNERFLQRNYRGFEKGKFLGHNDFIFSTASDLATYGLEIGDEIVCKVGWLGAYYDALKKGEADPIRYADDITRNAVAGRGIGELPPVVKSRLVNAIIPFQVEVLNNFNVRKRIWKSGSPGKVMLGFVNLYFGTFILNELYELLLGRRIDFDPIDAILSIIFAWDDDEESYYDQKGYAEYEQAGMMHDENYKGDEVDSVGEYTSNAFKAVDALLTLSGEWLANMPFASFFAGILAENDDINKVFNNKFGDSSPNRYGDGLIGIKTVFKECGKFIDGQNVNWKNLIFSYVKYGKQISRVLDFFEDYNIIPDINMNKKDGIWINGHSLDGTFEFLGDQTGRFSDWGTLSYPLDKNFEDMARDLLFGGVTTFSGREWVDSDFTSGLDEFQTAAWKSLVNQGYSSTSAHGLVRLISSIPKNSYNYLGQAYFVENADVDDDCKADLWYNLVFSNKDRLEFNYLLDNGATKAGAYKFYDYIAKVNAINGGWSKIDYAKALSLTGMSDAEQCKVYFDKYVPDYTMKVYDQFIEKGFSKQDIFDVVKLGFSLDWKPSNPDDMNRYNTYLQKAMETIEPKYILMTIGARATFNEQNSMQPGLDEWAGSDRIKTMINSFDLTAGQKDTLNTIIYNKGSLYYSPWRGKPVRWKGDPIPNGFMWDVEGKNAYTPDRVRDFLNDGGYADPNKYVKKFENLMKATAASKNKAAYNSSNKKTSMDYIQKRMDKIFNPSGRSYFGR